MLALAAYDPKDYIAMDIPAPGANAGPGHYIGASFLEDGNVIGVTG